MADTIRRDLESLLGETEYTLIRAADPEDLAARFPRASDRAALDDIETALKAAETKKDIEGKRRLEALRAGVAREWLRRITRERAEEIEDRFVRADVVLPGGARASAAEARRMQEHAPDRETRRACEQALASAAEALVDDRRELVRRRREAAQELGAKGVPELWARLTGLDPGKVVAGARRFLAATQDLYRDNLDWLLRRHDASLDRAEAHDLGWVRFNVRRTVPAPRDRMAKILDGAVKWLGLDPAAGGRVRRQPATAPPTRIARRKVPAEIYLSLFLEDGLPAWADALAAWTRALAAAHTPAALPMEDRVLGDPAVPLAWGEAFGVAPFERDWISRVLDFGKAKDASRELHALRLAETRRLCGLLEAEIDLHAGAPAAQLGERLSAATLARHAGALVLAEASPLLETAHRVRARAAAGSLLALLEKRFEAWWRNGETGKLALEAWSAGRRWPLEDLLPKLGAAADSFATLEGWFHARLA